MPLDSSSAHRFAGETGFGFEDGGGGLEDGIGIEGNAVDTLFDEEAGELGVVAGGLTADADLAFVFAAGGDDLGDHAFHGWIPFIEDGRDDFAVAVDAEDELGEVIGADAEAVEEFGEFVGEDHVAGDLAHDVDLEVVLAAFQSVPGHLGLDAPGFVEGATEGDHQLEVGESHLLADLEDGGAFEGEPGLITGMIVSAGAAEPDHGVFLDGFVGLAADEIGVFVGLEVAEAEDDVLGVKGGGDHRDALGELVDEVLGFVGVSGGEAVDLLFGGAVGQIGVMDEGEGMDADGVADDEFLAGEADAVIGDGGEGEGFLGIGDIHHDLGAGTAGLGEVGVAHLELQFTVVDGADIAAGAADGDELAVPEDIGAVFGADDGWDAEFAADDGGVAGPTAAIGDDGGGLLHDRFPVGIGLVGDEDFTGLKAGDGLGIGDDADAAGGDATADAASGDEDWAAGFEDEGFGGVDGLAGLDGLGPGLNDEEFAGVTILGPFDVHGGGATAAGGVMILNDAGPAGELEDLVFIDAESGTIAGGDGNIADHATAAEVIDEFEFLVAENLLEDGPVPGLEGGFEDAEFVGIDGALDDILAQTPGGIDQDGFLETGFRIDAEHHAAGGEVGADHALDPDAEGDVEVVEALVDAIGDGAVGEEGGVAAATAIEDGGDATDIEIGLVLAGDTGVGKILGGGTAADGDIQGMPVGSGKGPVSSLDFGSEIVGKFGSENGLTDLCAALAEIGDIVGVEPGEDFADPDIHAG